jgi:hypothetical protein
MVGADERGAVLRGNESMSKSYSKMHVNETSRWLTSRGTS